MIPRQAFITWLVVGEETCEHLPFSRPTSYRIWSLSTAMARPLSTGVWAAAGAGVGAAEMKRQVWVQMLKRAVFAACIFHVWTEHSRRVFTNRTQTVEEVYHVIKHNIMGALRSVNCNWKSIK
ncbi:hypothetical protein Ancab_014123 [Ancistrocladus abbreviatus]